MKKISIIGCGWLGLPVARNFVKLGHEVHGTTTSESKKTLFQEHGIVPHVVNLKAPNQDLSFLAESDIVLISFPPGLRKNTVDFPLQMDQLVTGLRQYLIQKIVFISSTSVYPTSGTFSEDSSISASSDRQKILLETEALLMDCFDATVIRMGGLYGENRYPHNFLKTEKQLETNTEINFINQLDAVELTTKLMLAKPTGVFNGVHPHHPLKYEFYQECYKRNNKLFDFNIPLKTDIRIINSKRMSEIGFEFTHNTHYDYLNS